jgi:hypothetical protein
MRTNILINRDVKRRNVKTTVNVVARMVVMVAMVVMEHLAHVVLPVLWVLKVPKVWMESQANEVKLVPLDHAAEVPKVRLVKRVRWVRRGLLVKPVLGGTLVLRVILVRWVRRGLLVKPVLGAILVLKATPAQWA